MPPNRPTRKEQHKKKNLRIFSHTLSPRQVELIERHSKALGISKSEVVRRLIDKALGIEIKLEGDIYDEQED